MNSTCDVDALTERAAHVEERRYWPSKDLDEVLLDAGRRGMSVYADDVGMYEMGYGLSAWGGEA